MLVLSSAVAVAADVADDNGEKEEEFEAVNSPHSLTISLYFIKKLLTINKAMPILDYIFRKLPKK